MLSKYRKLILSYSLLICMYPFLSTSTMAHHSVAGQFDVTEVVEWKGVISYMDWINPHSYVYLDVMGADNSLEAWRLETLPTAMFRKANISKAMLMGEGQEVVISGHTARDGSLNLGYIVRITYPDGHFYQLSAAPR